MIKLSVIIPIYNCEEYIVECINSICSKQTEDLQIICIDDCSQDNSLKMLKKLKEKYGNVEIYRNETNLGQAVARNIGLAHVEGEYITFVDADDYIDIDVVKESVFLADTKQADVVLFDTYMFADKQFPYTFDCKERIKKNTYLQEKGIDLLCAMIKNREMSGVVWGSIYKRKFLKEYRIKFIEGGQHEDIPFIFNALLDAAKVAYFHKIGYYYRQRCGSTIYSPNYEKLLYGLIRGYTNMQSVWENYKRENPCRKTDTEYINQYFHIIENMIEERYVHYLSCENVQTDEFITRQIQHFHFLEKNEVNTYISKEDFSVLSGEADISIYGAGYFAKKMFLLLRKNDIKISRFYVTRTESNPSSLFEIPVEEYQLVNCHGCIIIAVSKKYQEDILKQMKLDGRKKVFLLNN